MTEDEMVGWHLRLNGPGFGWKSVKLLQSCPTLCSPMDCSPLGSLSMGFSRQEYCSGLSCPPPGDLPNPGIKLKSLMSPALGGRILTTSDPWDSSYECQIKTRTRNQWTETFLEVTRECSQRRELQFNKALPDIEEVWKGGEGETRRQEEDFTEERYKA